MTYPSIYVVNIKHAAKELQELLADAKTPKDARMDCILIVVNELLEDAKNIKAWAVDQNLKGKE